MSRQIQGMTRPIRRGWPTHHPVGYGGGVAEHGCGGALVMTPLPVPGGGRFVFCGMDPSAPETYVRPWNPQPGMIAYLNFDGSQVQGHTSSGITPGPPESSRLNVRQVNAQAGTRPRRTRRGRQPR